jgi:iron complex transport system substrate-binding protein
VGIRKAYEMNKFFLWMLSIVILISGFPTIETCRAGSEIKVKDMVNREVTISSHPARVICLAPGALRLILYVGGKDKIVGVEDFEKANPKTRPYWIANSDLGQLPSIGPGGPNTINKEPDLEKVLAVDPDVIFMTYMGKAKAEALQHKINIPVVVLTYGPFGTFDEAVYDAMRLAGRILDKEDRANEVIQFIEGARKDLDARVKTIAEDQKPSVYIGGIGFKGSHGIESTETLYAPFEWVSAKNVAVSKGKKGHLFVDKEKLLAWNPDIIFIDTGGNELVRQDYAKRPDFYNGLNAFKKRKVHTLHSFNWYMTNLGTVVTDAYTVGKILYPEQFGDVDLEKKADQIYDFLVGKPVYREIRHTFGSLGEVPGYIK